MCFLLDLRWIISTTNDQYETLGGYIVYHTENIPSKGEIVKIGDYDFEIQKVTASKIEIVKIHVQ